MRRPSRPLAQPAFITCYITKCITSREYYTLEPTWAIASSSSDRSADQHERTADRTSSIVSHMVHHGRHANWLPRDHVTIAGFPKLGLVGDPTAGPVAKLIS
jgi:hypothetical protein